MTLKRFRAIGKLYFVPTIVFLLLCIAIVLEMKELSVVRELFTRASSEPANIIIDTRKVIGPLQRPWRHLAQGGEDHAWRMGTLIPKIAALHPAYIRIDHIYDFYDIVGGSSGNLTFNFSKLDGLLDDIKATGATPYISLSYMPPVISSSDIISAPRNYSDWQLTVQKTIEHISGTRATRDVYYEVWNEPDLFGGWKYYGNKSYLTLYEAAARGAQNAQGVQPFKIGGPATTALYKNWFDALATDAVKNNVRLDFISWHRYDTDMDRFKKDITDARTWIQSYPQLQPTIKCHITER